MTAGADGRTRLPPALLALACLALPLAAQGQERPSRRPADSRPALRPGAPEKPFPFGTTWVLRAIDGKPVAAADPPSFSLDQTLRATGFAGCNTFSMALYPIKDQKLAAGAIAMTRKVCDKGMMAAERGFLVGLHSLPRWEVSPLGDLTIRAPAAVMAFRRGI